MLYTHGQKKHNFKATTARKFGSSDRTMLTHIFVWSVTSKNDPLYHGGAHKIIKISCISFGWSVLWFYGVASSFKVEDRKSRITPQSRFLYDNFYSFHENWRICRLDNFCSISGPKISTVIITMERSWRDVACSMVIITVEIPVLKLYFSTFMKWKKLP